MKKNCVVFARIHKPSLVGVFAVILLTGLAGGAVFTWHKLASSPAALDAPLSNAKSTPSEAGSTKKLITSTSTYSAPDLADPQKKEIAMELVSSAENSTLDWRAQYGYIEDISDGRGYTGGIIGFTSGTGDMLEVVRIYSTLRPSNSLTKYMSALKAVNGTDSHNGLDPGFVGDWRAATSDTAFQSAQDQERDTNYFNPAVKQAKADGLHALGQFIYYDALVMHGSGNDAQSFEAIRAVALNHASNPHQGGNETTYLNAFLDARKAAMLAEPSHRETDRVDTEQRVFLKYNNLDLNPPLNWTTYGNKFTIH